jgi:hypothetical protein
MSQTQETKRYSVTLSRTTETTDFTQTRQYSTYAEAMEDYKKLAIEAADFSTLIEGVTTITAFYLPYGDQPKRVLKSFNLSSINNI